MALNLEDMTIDHISHYEIRDARNNLIFQWSDDPEHGKIRGCQIQPWDISWHNYASYDGDAKLGQVLYNTGLLQGIVTKITYDREKKWWQFWIRRKQTGCYVEWRER